MFLVFEYTDQISHNLTGSFFLGSQCLPWRFFPPPLSGFLASSTPPPQTALFSYIQSPPPKNIFETKMKRTNDINILPNPTFFVKFHLVDNFIHQPLTSNPAIAAFLCASCLESPSPSAIFSSAKYTPITNFFSWSGPDSCITRYAGVTPALSCATS